MVGHDTPVRPEASVPFCGGSVAMDAGAVNAGPFHAMKVPLLSTSMQKVVDGTRHGVELALGVHVGRLGPAVPVEHAGAALGGDAERRRDARDLVGGAPGPEVAGPARAVVGEGVPFAVDRDAERARRCSRWR